ncbi:MAG: BPSS1780 family membrane protein [Betaproteobacteria bacterium]
MGTPPDNEPDNLAGSFPVQSPAVPSPANEGRRVAAGQGFSWIGAAWTLFKAAPGSWVACFLIFVVIMILLAVVPLLGNIAGALLSPILIGGLMLGCRDIGRDEEMMVSHLFAGFKERSGPLFVLGLLEFGLSLVAMLIAALIIFLTVGAMIVGILMGNSPQPVDMLAPEFWLAMALVLAVVVGLFIPVTMAAWFAPALVALNGVEPLQALKSSFFACLKNFIPFLVYGIAMLVLAIVATIPLGLGWLLLGPVMIASIYTAYRDIFFTT